MIKVTTIETVRTIEASANDQGITYEEMMKRAGRTVADYVIEQLLDVEDPQVTVLVGAGNNGGDGLIAGLFVAQLNPMARVRFYLLAERPNDPYMAVAKEAELFVVMAENDTDKRLLRNMIASSDLVIDALFGIGVRLPLRDEAQRVLRTVNQVLNERRREKPESLVVNPAQTEQIPHLPPIRVIAVDVPSGLNADTGEIDKNALDADTTITFITAKYGLFLFDGAQAVGHLVIADLGIPDTLPAKKAVVDFLVDARYVKDQLPARPLNSHKGTFGKALVIGGSSHYVGAPLMASEACYRVGTGLVRLASTASVVNTLAPHSPETTWLALPDENGEIDERSVPTIIEGQEGYDSLLIGCGLSHSETTSKFLRKLFTNTITVPLVLDADALNILSEVDNWASLLPPNTVITPHPTEMARLCGITTAEVTKNRWELARQKAKEWHCVVLLKGAHTLIADPNGTIAVLPFKTDALAKAGTGDILAGMVAGFVAQGLPPFEATVVASYVHGLAGIITTETMSSRSTMARDILATIPTALSRIELS